MLIAIKEVRKILAGSENRKHEITNELSELMKSAAAKGLTSCSLPAGLSDAEKEWLKEELVLEGYSMVNGMSMVCWKS